MLAIVALLAELLSKKFKKRLLLMVALPAVLVLLKDRFELLRLGRRR